MKELLVVSGKGGTGKTTIAAALAVLTQDKVIADCDVDAADLWLVLHPASIRKDAFRGLDKAIVDRNKCIGCGLCFEVCRFDAVGFEGQIAVINRDSCEGCGVCFRCCPQKAIEMKENIAGHVMESQTKYGYMVHAQLGVGEENSGRLVAEVRKRAREAAERLDARCVIIDGPPGIGCPVISAVTGVDMALVVTEPTVAGRHDLERILDLLSHFKVPVVVCVNKSDLDEGRSLEIAQYCASRCVEVVGEIPFDEDVPRTLAQGQALGTGQAAREMRRVADRVHSLMAI